MYRELLRDFETRLRDTFASTDVRYAVAIGEPASPDGIAACEAALGRPLPADLAALYAECDGFRTVVTGPQGVIDYVFGIASTVELVPLARRLVDFIEEVAETWTSVRTDWLERSLLVIDGAEKHSWLLTYERASEDDDRYRLAFVHFDDSMWTLEGVDRIDESLYSYVQKSLSFLIDSRGKGFWYLDPAGGWPSVLDW